MKKLYDIYIPDNDDHFPMYLKKIGEMFGQHTYQQKQRDKSLSFVPKFGVAVDIGAHIGTWTIDLEQKFDKVICFEPLPLHLECLRKNIKDHNKVEIFEVGLGDITGKEVFIDYEEEGNTGTAAVLPRSLATPSTGHKIKLERLDSFNIPKIDYMKVDIEGYELPFLKGAKETFLRTKPVLNIEIKSTCQRFGTEPQEIVNYLEEELGMMCVERCVNDFVFVYRHESS
jgi:FkbM family methyltransferase